MVDEEGLEPSLLTEPDPKSGAAANYATRPYPLYYMYLGARSTFFWIKINFIEFLNFLYIRILH